MNNSSSKTTQLKLALAKLQFLHSSYDYLRLSIASPKKIRSWSDRNFPDSFISGEVTSEYTLSYETNELQPSGLFCQQIFGPTRSWYCECLAYHGFSKYAATSKKVCEICKVEITSTIVRRYRMGYIELAYPVAHTWYINGQPNYIFLLLAGLDPFKISRKERARAKKAKRPYPRSLKPTDVKEILYFDLISDDNPLQRFKKFERNPNQFAAFGHTFAEPFSTYNEKAAKLNIEAGQKRARMGAELLRSLLEEMELDYDKQISRDRDRFNVPFKKFSWDRQKRPSRYAEDLKRIRILESFKATNSKLSWMILTVLPVLPPTLRPIVSLEDGAKASSDLNEFYKIVLIRNASLRDFYFSSGDFTLLMTSSIRMLQLAVDQLIDNASTEEPNTLPSNDKPLKSLTEILEAKEGRFRDNLLGKRTDYSGRSVITVGAGLQLNQCGLPYDIAVELFKPTLIKVILAELPGLDTYDVSVAEFIIDNRRLFVWKLLEKIIRAKCILLNRAPTLHRFGVQAFTPILVLGKAIQLHPLVCAGFNADFDGDQMAVHVPLYHTSQLEARTMMLPMFNVLSPANGDVILKPTQDIVIGCHYLTVAINCINSKIKGCFITENDVLTALQLKKLDLHNPILVRYSIFSFEITIDKTTIVFNDTYTFLSKKEVFLYKIFQANTSKKQYYLLTNIGIFIAHSVKNHTYHITELLLETTAGRIIFSRQCKAALELK